MALGVILAAVGYSFLRGRVDDEIRRQIETRFAKHYSTLKVSVRSAEFIAGEGIKVRDLTISEPGAEGPRAELLAVEELFLVTRTELKELVYREPAITQVIIRRPKFNQTRRLDGAWSLMKLLPPPSFGTHPPEVTIENGTIEVFDPSKSHAGAMTLRDFNAKILPRTEGLADGSARELREIQGVVAGEHFRSLEFTGVIDPRTEQCIFKGSLEGLEVSPSLRDALPAEWAAKFGELKEFRAEANVSAFQVRYDKSQAKSTSFSLAGKLTRGRIIDSRLPHPLTDIEAAFHADDGGLVIENMKASSNKASIRLTGAKQGLSESGPMRIVADVYQLELDRELQIVLPKSLQDQWLKYRPSGEVNAHLEVNYDGKTWKPNLALDCLNVAFIAQQFPYRLERGTGRLTMNDDKLSLNMTAYSGRQPIKLWADVDHPMRGPTGRFEASGEDVTIDDALIEALPAKPKAEVKKLDPRGFVDFRYEAWRDEPGALFHQRLKMAANRCSVRYAAFPYQLDGVNGQIEMFDNRWTFSNFTGSHGAASISAEGALTPTLRGNEMTLSIAAKNVPLEKDLRDAMPMNMQNVWLAMKPRGIIDVPCVIVTKRTESDALNMESRPVEASGLNLNGRQPDAAGLNLGAKQPEGAGLGIEIFAEPQAESSSIEPTSFPYRLEKLSGSLHYKNGCVTFDKFTARHGQTKITSKGSCVFEPEGPWRLKLENLTVDGLKAERDVDFVQALPEAMKRAVHVLSPTGAINFQGGTIEFIHDGRQGAPLQSRWDLLVGLWQNTLQCGGFRLENVCGSLAVRGSSDGNRFQSRGELNLDAYNYKDYQFTNVRGPIWIDDQRVLFGSWVDAQFKESAAGNPSAPKPRQVSANIFGGTIYADGWVQFGEVPKYGVNASLVGADLGLCAQESGEGRQKLRGKVAGRLDLIGSGSTRNAMSGKGKIELSEADVYELPAMVALLKVLSVRPPDRNAFSDASMSYRIEGEHIYFDEINFRGDAISLLGKGEMDWQSNIAMNFQTVVGRVDSSSPWYQKFFTDASRGIMTIKVDGTLQDPKMRKEAFPVMNEAFQQMQHNRQNR